MRSPGTGAGQDLIIDKSHGTGGSTGWFFQSRPGVGIVDFGMGNGTGFPLVSSNEEIFDDEWHHLAGTYDGNVIEFFVDGISQGTIVVGIYSDNPNPVRMGNTATIPRYFKGHLDEVRISDVVLNKSDFLLSPPPPTIAFWRFEEGVADAAATIVADSSDNTNTGTPTGWFFQSRPGVGIVDFGMGNGTGFPFVSSNEEIFDDEWHHLAGSYDGNTIEFFVDGISQGTLEAGTYLDNPNPVRIGNTQLFPRFFKGHIDEVRISNFVVDKSDFLLSLLSFAIPDIASTTTITVEGTERFGIQYNRQSPGTTDPENIYTSENYSYVVELSIDLNNWTSIGSEVVYLPAIDQGNGIETVSVYLLDAFTPKPVRQFMRIRVLGL
jgi:hypothetical protein